jgi:hypothetical protein
MQTKFYFFILFLIFCACKKTMQKPIVLAQQNISTHSLFAVLSIHDSIQMAGGGDEFVLDQIFVKKGASITWQNPIVPTTFRKSILCFLHQKNNAIMAMGTTGYMATSADSGASWVFSQLPNYKSIQQAVHVNHHILLACNASGNGSIVILDTNKNVLHETTFLLGIKSICMGNDSIGYATSTGAIFKTIDAGFSWQFTAAKGDIFTSSIALSANDCIAVGFDGSMQRTKDGGVNWVNIKNQNTVSTADRWNKIIAINTTSAIAIGDDGKMVKIDLQNNTYQKMQSITDADLLDVCIKNKNTICIVSSAGDYFEVKIDG